MYHVYALKSALSNRIYVGLTNNLSRRINEHNLGRVYSTKGYRPWSLIYCEQVPTITEARKKEKYLKSGYGKETLKLIPL